MFENVSVFSLNGTVLLQCLRTSAFHDKDYVP